MFRSYTLHSKLINKQLIKKKVLKSSSFLSRIGKFQVKSRNVDSQSFLCNSSLSSSHFSLIQFSPKKILVDNYQEISEIVFELRSKNNKLQKTQKVDQAKKILYALLWLTREPIEEKPSSFLYKDMSKITNCRFFYQYWMA